MNLSGYVFEALRKDKEFILYRGRSKDDGSQVLVLSPAAEYSTPESLKRLEHECSLREELDPAGLPGRSQLLATGTVQYSRLRIPAACLSINCSVSHWTSVFVASGYQPFDRDWSLASARHHPQGHQAGQCSRKLRYRPVLADGLWYRFAASTRAPVSRASGVRRWNTRLYGPRADRTNESFHRFPERSLRPRRHALRNADW